MTNQVYRGSTTELPGTYGSCLHPGVTVVVDDDTEVPPVGAVFVYHVTVSNRLGEEGTLGWDSAGAPRPNADPCP